ncbi:DUF4097 family beta strand repeat-containing protein [Sphaerisporangium krabiense]|uniref:DUF4097 domain-containing protein n=1 Tax=Sphaerisporangium krabiense TaxID=763782 RepID=A0A7W8Z7A4_9ACTN|nr:DUF4097 family beta strand repeat-containing protein [Sphaerisporangium krabiense]MBB5628706.1 hypothetical protein [Sphaerisporangium krabiense]
MTTTFSSDSSGFSGSAGSASGRRPRGLRGRARPVMAAGVVLGAGLLLSACGLENIAGPTQQATESYDVTGRIGLLRVDSGSGDIVVTESARTGVRVTETLHWRSEKPKTAHPMDGDTLKLGYSCQNGGWSCGVDYQVEVPRGLNVKLEAGSGDITLRALSGRVDARTGSGEVDARGLGTTYAEADSGSGDVELRFTGVPEYVRIESGSGDGIVHVPQNSYHVSLTTGSGDHALQVTNDPASPRRIVVRSGSGDAKVLKA